MSQDKTEQPSQKKLDDSRKKGQVAKSADLTQAALFLTAGAALQLAGASLTGKLAEAMRASFRPEIFRAEYGPAEMYEWTVAAWAGVAVALAPVLGAVMLMAIVVNFVQVRAMFSLDVVKPKFNKLNPLEGFKNIFFKGKTYFDLARNLVKLIVIAWLAWRAANGMLGDLAATGGMNVGSIASIAASTLFRLLYQCGAAFLVIGAADYMMQKKFMMKDLMMSKEEVKNEYKDSEGDPHVKHRRKELHQEMLAESDMDNVGHASAVVVNPVHLAVAILYDDSSMGAPRVTANGRGLRAQAIKELARKHNVPVVEDVPLAHRLITIEPGHEIPEEMYEPVAEILLWVQDLARQQQEKPR
jgi:type III secretion YscU/HrpY family protein